MRNQPQKKTDKDMGREVEHLGGYRPQAVRLAPRGHEMAPRGITRTVEIVSITFIGPRRRQKNRLYQRGL